EELTGHGFATGAEAARRAARAARSRRIAVPTRAAPPDALVPEPDPVPIPSLPVYPHPELFLGRTHGFVDFSEDVSSKDLAAAAGGGEDSAGIAPRLPTETK